MQFLWRCYYTRRVSTLSDNENVKVVSSGVAQFAVARAEGGEESGGSGVEWERGRKGKQCNVNDA